MHRNSRRRRAVAHLRRLLVTALSMAACSACFEWRVASENVPIVVRRAETRLEIVPIRVDLTSGGRALLYQPRLIGDTVAGFAHAAPPSSERLMRIALTDIAAVSTRHVSAVRTVLLVAALLGASAYAISFIRAHVGNPLPSGGSGCQYFCG